MGEPDLRTTAPLGVLQLERKSNNASKMSKRKSNEPPKRQRELGVGRRRRKKTDQTKIIFFST